MYTKSIPESFKSVSRWSSLICIIYNSICEGGEVQQQVHWNVNGAAFIIFLMCDFNGISWSLGAYSYVEKHELFWNSNNNICAKSREFFEKYYNRTKYAVYYVRTNKNNSI